MKILTWEMVSYYGTPGLLFLQAAGSLKLKTQLPIQALGYGRVGSPILQIQTPRLCPPTSSQYLSHPTL